MNCKNIFVLLIVLSAFSCKSPKEVLQDYKGTKISIGSGGGFTGAYNEYIFLENGSIYQINTLKKDTVFVGALPESEIEQLLSNYELLDLNRMNLDDSGNFNYFIKSIKEGNEHKLQWNSQSKVDKGLKLFYNILMSKIKKIKQK